MKIIYCLMVFIVTPPPSKSLEKRKWNDLTCRAKDVSLFWTDLMTNVSWETSQPRYLQRLQSGRIFSAWCQSVCYCPFSDAKVHTPEFNIRGQVNFLQHFSCFSRESIQPAIRRQHQEARFLIRWLGERIPLSWKKKKKNLVTTMLEICGN